MNNVKVSVYCLAYNCAKFFEKSIQGMLNQKVNFQYKIIVHDDASTDGTADLIRRYAAQYPDKICAILQSENQYSKGVSIVKTYVEPELEGKYVALCEGDDYWIDENKLQLQYDYMEAHPECTLCAHNTEIYDLSINRKTGKFNNWETIHVLTEEEVFLYGTQYAHTSSYFMRKDIEKWKGNTYWFGDLVMITWAFYQGKVVLLPQIMSIYNAHNPNGLMWNQAKLRASTWINERKDVIKYMNEYNEITKYKFNDYIQKRISLVDYECLVKEFNDMILYSHSKEKIINAAKKVRSHESYTEFLHRKSGIRRLIRRYRYEGYFFYPLWKIIMKKFVQNGPM